MQKSKSNYFVIYPSSVRSIPFAVPPRSSSSAAVTDHQRQQQLRCEPRSLDGSYASCCSSSAGRHDDGSRLSTSFNLGLSFLEDRCFLSADSRSKSMSRCMGLNPGQSTDRECSLDQSNRWKSEPDALRDDNHRRSFITKSNSNNVNKLQLNDANSVCGINPSLYINPDGSCVDREDVLEMYFEEGNIGRVWFGIEYDPESERLLISVIMIKHLPSRSTGTGTCTNSCDPYLRICLVPDERRWLQSKVKKKTCNPRFDETFAFQVSLRDFPERLIRLTVYDSGERHKHQSVIGHVLYALKDHSYEPKEKVVVCRDLERQSTPTKSEKSEINISLSYNSQLARISIGVYTAKNLELNANDTTDTSSHDFYVSVSLLEKSRVVKKKKTSIVKHCTSSNPIFNEMFHFKVAQSNLDTVSIIMTAMRYIIGHRDKPVGRVVLGSFMFARGPELDHWNAMLAAEKEQTSRWHTLSN